MTLRIAQRQKAKIRGGFSAVSGAGKTYSALLVAKGLSKYGLSKVAIIDTENGSADLYSHLGEYNVLPLSAPYSPESYVKAIKVCEDAGMEVIIIDSITHEWDGKGGCLEIHAAMDGNSYTNWKSVSPRHQKFLDAILQSKCHVLTTVRRKQDYEMATNDKGKVAPVKVGLKEVTREGYEYELTFNLEIDNNHYATCSKDRTGLFADQPPFIPSEETGKIILDWCELGIEPIKSDPYIDLNNCTSLGELQKVWLSLSSADQANYLALKDTIKGQLSPQPAPPSTTPILLDTIIVDELNACKTLPALQKAWTAISADEKPKYEELKNEIKGKLTPKK